LRSPIGVLTAVKQYSWFDHIVTGTIFTFLSTPTFWLGLLLIIVFGLQFGAGSPLGGIQTVGAPFDLGDRLKHLILPVATIALVADGRARALPTRVDARDDRQDYMRTARAKGLTERNVILRHALKNAAIPLVTIIALDMPELFVGALVTGADLRLAGMGRLFWGRGHALRLSRAEGHPGRLGEPHRPRQPALRRDVRLARSRGSGTPDGDDLGDRHRDRA